jgi:hypothetical protein
MMRKSTLSRLLCLSLLAVPAAFGALNATARPAHALMCSSTFFGCSFTGIADYGNMICCHYTCANGHERDGVCEQV